jgi:hypothetical protein
VSPSTSLWRGLQGSRFAGAIRRANPSFAGSASRSTLHLLPDLAAYRHNLSLLALTFALRPSFEGIEFFGVPLGVGKQALEPFVEIPWVALKFGAPKALHEARSGKGEATKI